MALSLVDQPWYFFAFTLVVMLLASYTGLRLRRRRGAMTTDEREDLSLVLTSSLTLLALIIGFSFSMAVGRYDERKHDEAVEAKTIRTEYLRAGLLAPDEATRLRAVLRRYISERIATYAGGTESVLLENRSTSKSLQQTMWSIVEQEAATRPNSMTSLVLQGMNDLIDAQAYAAAAWDNRIPFEAWALMFVIALFCCALIGFDTRRPSGRFGRHLVLPVLIAISFFMIADLDSTHQGLIRVTPDNLVVTAQSLNG